MINLKLKMKYFCIVLIITLASCGQTSSTTDESEVISADTVKGNENNIPAKSTDRTVKFLWRDKNSAMIIDKEFCKTITTPEKAALGYVATFIGNECSWDGAYTENRSNLKCEILTALGLGYQCSEKHLGFLRNWFRDDAKSLKELENCPTTPNTATIQDTFDEITITTKGNKISIFFKANGVNLREETSWSWSETNDFEVTGDKIKLVKKDKSAIDQQTFGIDKHQPKERDFSKMKNQSLVISCGSGCAMTYNVKAIKEINSASIKVTFEVDLYENQKLTENYPETYIFHYGNINTIERVNDTGKNGNIADTFMPAALETFREFGKKLIQ
jgi:3D (Asp-Asp-Asp) domain-containing protein